MSRGVSGPSIPGNWAPSGAKTTSPPGGGTLLAPHTTNTCSRPPRSMVTKFQRRAFRVRLLTQHLHDQQRLEPRTERAHAVHR